ncbi:hypothetical protein XELAEV_18011678mg [Xenopus laevis]|uniref:Ankyrin repeat domain-containing protein n=1 Tax=Xenopus laevis TaxID=8355 RepID=A0A974DMC8_XENLA|nr:hypothetical protein XELAEV_18011678mg [Xenopus laevis]
MMPARKGPDSRYPLHCLVWHNKYRELEKELTDKQEHIEQVDPRGRTPLHLATTLGHLECAKVLLKHGADVSKENRSGWTVLQEAVSTRDLELVRLVLRYRDYQRAIKRLAGIPILLEKLRKAQDFYVEMKWEFTSWGISVHGRHLLLFRMRLACRQSEQFSVLQKQKNSQKLPKRRSHSDDYRSAGLVQKITEAAEDGARELRCLNLHRRICPSDTYKVWKSGQNLRVDTTLLGFDHMTWQRGNRSFIFKGQGVKYRVDPIIWPLGQRSDHNFCYASGWIKDTSTSRCRPRFNGKIKPAQSTAAYFSDIGQTSSLKALFPISTDTSAVVMEIDHDRRVVFTETLTFGSQDHEVLLAAVQPTEEQAMSRLTAPVVTTQLDTKNIAFERNKSGILGWRSEKTEVVNGYEAKVGWKVVHEHMVYGASNVELITRTRTEHLSDQHKGKSKGSKTPLQSFLGIAEQHVGPNNGQTLITQTFSQTNPTAITPDEYFDPNFELGHRDMGRPMELTTKTQKFKAKLWLCEDHPLSLSEQVAPIIDLMAISNALFAKLRDFITLRLPPGFPVKIEIPIFHILNARITFGNLNGCDEPVSSLRQSPSSEAPSPSSDSCSVSSTSSISMMPHQGDTGQRAANTSGKGCEMDQSLFEAPRGYSMVGSYRETMREEEDDLLQFAIQQSLLEAGSEYDQVTIWEALTNSKPGTHLMSNEGRKGERNPKHTQPRNPPHTDPGNAFSTYQEQLRFAMKLSAKEQEEAEKLKQQEEEELERILQLSLTEK